MFKKTLLATLLVSVLIAGGAVGLSLIRGAHSTVSGAALSVVIIDAGHGGRDPGVVVAGVHESGVNLEIAEQVSAILMSQPGLDVVMTRDLDVYLSHEARIGVANDSGASLYISIQANAYTESGANGIETWVDKNQLPGSESWKMAELVQQSLISGTAARDRGVRSMELYLGGMSCPAILVETGFLTNPQERAKLLNREYQQMVAQCIADGILLMLN
jgi:N-acetylmuramoyl-L-alanine amidase